MADITGSVRSRIAVNTVTSAARAAITATRRRRHARICAYPNRPNLPYGKCRGSQRGSSESRGGSSWSDRRPLDRGPAPSAQMRRESISGTADRAAFAVARRGSSVRMGPTVAVDRCNRRARRRRAALLWINPEAVDKPLWRWIRMGQTAPTSLNNQHRAATSIRTRLTAIESVLRQRDPRVLSRAADPHPWRVATEAIARGSLTTPKARQA